MTEVTIDYSALPELPVDDTGPVFVEPWQATAFALAVTLCEQGHFTWSEWVAAFSHEVQRAKASGDPDLGDTYYQHWLKCLESLIASKNILTTEALLQRKDAWAQAYLNTPHGEPIELDNAVRWG